VVQAVNGNLCRKNNNNENLERYEKVYSGRMVEKRKIIIEIKMYNRYI